MRKIKEVLEFSSACLLKSLRLKQSTLMTDGRPAREERGIALIMTLGVLSMLLILALAFASSVRTERKAASAGADIVQARLLAESAVNRIAALAQNYHDIVSHTSAASHSSWPLYNVGNNENRDFIYRLATMDYYGTELFGWSKGNTPLTSNSNINYSGIHWDYIIMPVDGVNKIVGRLAYTMIPETGIDPAALVQSGADESAYHELRYGANMYEINVRSLNDSTNSNALFPGAADSYVAGFSWQDAGGTFENAWGGPKPAGNGWVGGFTVMFDNSHLNVTNTDHQNAMKSWFVENPVATDEKFWIDLNDDGVQDSNEFHHRFNLARTDWDTPGGHPVNSDAGVQTILGLATPLGGATAPGPWEWSLDGAADGIADNICNGASIPWLANWTDAGTFPNALTRAKQIAANLIDYCDTDSIPTSDVPANSWSNANRPTYTGNEKTYCINEAHLYFTSEQKAEPFNDGTDNFKWNSYMVSAVLTVELVDIYGGVATVPEIFASGALSFRWRKANGDWETVTQNFTDQPVDFGANTIVGYSSNSVVVYSDNLGTNLQRVKNDVPPADPEITNFSWYISSIVIRDGANGVDYAVPYSGAGAASSVASLGTGDNTFYVQVSNQVEDPRQNLNHGDWPAPVVQVDSGGAPALISTMRANNTNADPSASGKDAETTNDVLNISTAFIANRPMVSPWELGLIHRGAKWETINLKEYNVVAKASSTAGGGAYTNDGTNFNGGDANILDQIKMIPDTQSPMKVSYSVAAANDILYALLHNIRIGSTLENGSPEKIANTGSQITGADVSNVVAGILNSSADFITRASVANSLTTGGQWALSGGVCATQNTDALQEELIGKFINLTTMDSITETSQSDFFNAIVIAQTIKDVGGDGVDVPIFRDVNGDGQIGTSASVNESTMGYDIDGLHGGFLGGSGKYNDFSAFATDSFTVNEQIDSRLGRYDMYADEILAEQKLKVQLYRHPSTSATPGRIEIISIEYLD